MKYFNKNKKVKETKEPGNGGDCSCITQFSSVIFGILRKDWIFKCNILISIPIATIKVSKPQPIITLFPNFFCSLVVIFWWLWGWRRPVAFMVFGVLCLGFCWGFVTRTFHGPAWQRIRVQRLLYLCLLHKFESWFKKVQLWILFFLFPFSKYFTSSFLFLF